MLPLDKGALVREPDFCLDAHGALVLDPVCGFLDARGDGLVLEGARFGGAVRLRILGCAPGGEQGAQVAQRACVFLLMGAVSLQAIVVGVFLLDRVFLPRSSAVPVGSPLHARHVRRGSWRGGGLLEGRALRCGGFRGRRLHGHEAGSPPEGARPLPCRPQRALPKQTPDHHVLRLDLPLPLLLLRVRLVRVPPDIRLHHAQPEGERIHVVLEKTRDAVHELGEARCLLDEVAGHEIRDPLVASTAFDLELEHSEGEAVDLPLADARERVAQPRIIDVAPVPVVRIPAGAGVVDGVLADEGEVRVQGDADAVVAGDLEGGARVVCAQDGLQVVRADEGLHVLRFGLQLLCARCVALLFEARDLLLHGIGAVEEGLDVLVLDGEA